MTNIQKILWLTVAAALVGFTSLIILNPTALEPSQKTLSKLFGGAFVMTKHDGTKFTDKDLLGKPYAIFFGFTHCPEVCPTTLHEMTQTIAELGNEADKMNYVFVSVDPARDTQDLLKDYMSNFDKRIIGLRGTDKQTKTIAKAYRVYYAKVGDGPDYNINHTATTYLMNSKGEFVGTLAYQENAKSRLAKLQRLVRGKAVNK